MKKRLFSLLLGAFVLGTLMVLSTQTTAQTNGQPTATQPTTRIAILNLSYVVKNYAKYTDFTNDMKKQVEVYETRVKAKKASYDQVVKEATKPDVTPQAREGFEKQIKSIQRELEDITNEGKRFVGQRSDEQMVALYGEIQRTAVRYASARGYEMVLHFNDAQANTPEYLSPANIARKMQAGALMPLYVHPSLDISPLVVQTLNQGYEQEKAKGAAQPRQ